MRLKLRFSLPGVGGGEQTQWGARFGLGNFQKTTAPLHIPHLTWVHKWIGEMPSLVREYAEPCQQHAWRQLRIGTEGSQMQITQTPGSLPTGALTFRNTRRRSKASMPRWQLAAETEDRWRRMQVQEMIPNHDQTLSFLREKGISSRQSAHAYQCALRAALKRCRVLLRHCEEARASPRHVSVAAHPSQRTQCILCGTSAYFALDKKWFMANCPSPVGDHRSVGVAEAMRRIVRLEQTYQQEITTLVKMQQSARG